MSNTVRNALVFAGIVTLAIALLILAWRIVRWLFIAAIWLIALTVVGAVLISKCVALQAPIWIERLGRLARDDQAPAQSGR